MRGARYGVEDVTGTATHYRYPITPILKFPSQRVAPYQEVDT